MPILEIRALPQKDATKVQPALEKTCCAIAKAYGCEPNQVWATWQEIKPGWYVEGNTPSNMQPETTHPPVGRLICFEGKDPQTIESTLLAAATTLSEGLGMPGNIFIKYDEALSGRVVAGNGVIRK